MNKTQVRTTYQLLNVKERGGEYRIKGFLLDYIPSPITDYVMLKGRIPFSLAEAIYEQHVKYRLDIYYFNCSYEDPNHPIEKKYIDRIKIDSVEALKFVIETIREHPYINEWAIGNY
jgi:hypothetical protein